MVWDTNYCDFIDSNYWSQRLSDCVEKDWKLVGYIKGYFSKIQKDMTDMENVFEDEISLEKKYSNQTKNKKKDEWW